MRTVVTLLAVGAVLPAAAPSFAATPTMRGTVGPDDTIRLVAKPRKAGTYRLTVQDRANEHNFRLRGPGVNVATGVGAAGTTTFRVRLQAGKTYTFVCDPHADEMRGSFRIPG
jgi:hypothetical protein